MSLLGITGDRAALSADAAGKLSAARTPTALGRTVAVQTSKTGTVAGVVTDLSADPAGTATVNQATDTSKITVRYFDPFGNPRDSSPVAWPVAHGFLDKPLNPATGTTHLGARDYDPRLARFLSVDPLLDPADPQSLNGYTYADNNPITKTDPTGLGVADYLGPGQTVNDHKNTDTDWTKRAPIPGKATRRPDTLYQGAGSTPTHTPTTPVPVPLAAPGWDPKTACTPGYGCRTIDPATGGGRVSDLGKILGIAEEIMASPITSPHHCATDTGWGSCAEAAVGIGLTVCSSASVGICTGAKGAKDAAKAAKRTDEAGRVSKGAIADAVPRNLPQQPALGAAKSGQGAVIMRGSQVAGAPRVVANYGAGDWAKMQYVLRDADSNATMHCFRNLATGLDVECELK
ncbi:MAG: RHS repeat-associated core domain-containing protein [Actinomycetia bacterium]|nr:RHS repeat-associated core domain-containing protein [Actinomycetes bacterium]